MQAYRLLRPDVSSAHFHFTPRHLFFALRDLLIPRRTQASSSSSFQQPVPLLPFHLFCPLSSQERSPVAVFRIPPPGEGNVELHWELVGVFSAFSTVSRMLLHIVCSCGFEVVDRGLTHRKSHVSTLEFVDLACVFNCVRNAASLPCHPALGSCGLDVDAEHVSSQHPH